MCQRAGPGGERRAFERLVEIRPGSWPNPLIIAIADRLMSRGGRMLEALDRDLIKWL
jgi:predicted protein tyrosine phosphatase